jgi:hypothetical protein
MEGVHFEHPISVCSQHISKLLIVPKLSWPIQMHSLSILPIFLIAHSIFGSKYRHLYQRPNHNEQARPTRDPHPLPIIRLISEGENVSAKHRTALPARGQERKSTGSFGVCGMGVGDPGEDQGGGGEDDGGEHDAEVADAYAGARCEADVADCGGHGGGCDEGATDAETVGDIGCGDHNYEGEDVGRRAEAVGLNGGEGAHFGDDGGNEEREGREADIAAEVHDRGWVAW